MIRVVVGACLYMVIATACAEETSESLILPTFSSTEVFDAADIVAAGYVVEILPSNLGCVLVMFRLQATNVIKGDLPVGGEVLVGLTRSSAYKIAQREHMLMRVGDDQEFLAQCDMDELQRIDGFRDLYLAIGGDSS